MSKVAIMTDSNCGFMPDEGEKLGISVIPMPIIVDDRLTMKEWTSHQNYFIRK